MVSKDENIVVIRMKGKLIQCRGCGKKNVYQVYQKSSELHEIRESILQAYKNN